MSNFINKKLFSERKGQKNRMDNSLSGISKTEQNRFLFLFCFDFQGCEQNMIIYDIQYDTKN